MFYPVESLKRGGRFYLCWVADSWPVQFASITPRNLWSYNICKLCDDLMEVVTSESGRSVNRFSLRLSSQLLRGLCRVYEKKANLLLRELCMISAQVFKHANKKKTYEKRQKVPRPVPQEQLPRPELAAEPHEQLPRPELAAEPHEQRVEEIIQNSGNVVANINDITLKEATIPDILLPPNDGFGEENPDQTLQQLLQNRTVEQILELDMNPLIQIDCIADRTVEQMLHQPDTSAAQHSGLDLDVDKSNKSNADKSRLVQDRQMERISEYDMPLMRKSTVPPPVPMDLDFEKDIPEIPEIVPPQPPVMHDPEIPVVPQIVISEPEAPAVHEPAAAVEKEAPKQPEPEVDIELEELEQEQLSRGGRSRRALRGRHLIVDKVIKLSTEFLRARIDNIHVEQRCEKHSDDIVDLRVPIDTLLKRPALAGDRLQARGSSTMLAMFQRRLVTQPRPYDSDIQESDADHIRRLTRSVAAMPQQGVAEHPPVVAEEPEPRGEPLAMELADVDKTRASDAVPNISDVINVTDVVPNLEQTMNIPHMEEIPQVQVSEMANVQQIHVEQPMDEQLQRAGASDQPLDISEMPTQVLQPLSQMARNSPTKRASQQDRPPKKSRQSGIVEMTFHRESSSTSNEKENVPPGNARPRAAPTPAPAAPTPAPAASQQHTDVSSMLLEAGIADIQTRRSNGEQASTSRIQSQPRVRKGSDSSETPLGSLDRTQVCLGDDEVEVTETQRFTRQNWGIEGTMVKIIDCIRRGSETITVHELIKHGPVLPGQQRIMAAKCFYSILKLKQHGFIKISKDPETSEIVNITLGSRFDQCH